MSEDRFNHIEKTQQDLSSKVDKLVEGFAALTEQNKQIDRLAEKQDQLESRVLTLETGNAKQQARRDLILTFFTRVIPVIFLVGGGVLSVLKLYVDN